VILIWTTVVTPKKRQLWVKRMVAPPPVSEQKHFSFWKET